MFEPGIFFKYFDPGFIMEAVRCRALNTCLTRARLLPHHSEIISFEAKKLT